MSDDELAGEDEKSFAEHFAPVYRSLKRVVTSRSMRAYAVSFVGIVVLAASLGGGVLGAYATFQEDAGLCGDPIVDVTPPEKTAELAAGDAQPTLPQLDYAELTPDERRGFREAVASANNDAKIEGDAEHLDAFRTGALVEYRGEKYYASISSMNDCVAVDALTLPLSIAGLVVGAAIVVAPGLWRRVR